MTVRYHDLNVFHEYWDPLLSGDRTFDIRLDDRGFQRGDIVVYHKLEKGSKFERDSDYSPVQFRIMWILSGGKFGIEAGHVAFSIEPTYDILDEPDEGGPIGVSDRGAEPVRMDEGPEPLHADAPKRVAFDINHLNKLIDEAKAKGENPLITANKQDSPFPWVFDPIKMEQRFDVGKSLIALAEHSGKLIRDAFPKKN